MSEKSTVSSVTSKTVVRPYFKTVDTPIIRRISPDAIADDLASRISGTLIDVADIFDVKTGQFVTEDELRASGCTFTSVSYRKDIIPDMTKKDRVTKELPVWSQVFKTWTIVFLIQIDWKKFILKRSNLSDVQIAEQRSNGVENYHCQGIGKTRAGFSTINGVVFKTVKKSEYRDENGDTIAPELLVNFLPKKADPAKQEKKYGISADKMPLYRTVRIDNCEVVKAFGLEYIPTE